MPELKLDFKTLGAIRLMPLETSSLFLPFGQPVADYVRGLAGNQNGTRALVKQGSIEFLPRIRWTESTSGMLRTTGFGELEREGNACPTAGPAVSADPGTADFLPFGFPDAAAKDANQAKMAPAIAPEDFPISKPRITALPLRPRMTFGPAPTAKAKVAPTPRSVRETGGCSVAGRQIRACRGSREIRSGPGDEIGNTPGRARQGGRTRGCAAETCPRLFRRRRRPPRFPPVTRVTLPAPPTPAANAPAARASESTIATAPKPVTTGTSSKISVLAVPPPAPAARVTEPSR